MHSFVHTDVVRRLFGPFCEGLLVEVNEVRRVIVPVSSYEAFLVVLCVILVTLFVTRLST